MSDGSCRGHQQISTHNFLLDEIPFYAATIAWFGTSIATLKWTALGLYRIGLMFWTGLLVRSFNWRVGLIFATVMLTLSPHFLLLASSPDIHFGIMWFTPLILTVLWKALRASPSRPWWTLFAIIVLGFVTFSDPLALVVIWLPVAVLAVWVKISRRTRIQAFLILALSLGASYALSAAFRAHGTAFVLSPTPAWVGLSRFGTNLSLLVYSMTTLVNGRLLGHSPFAPEGILAEWRLLLLVLVLGRMGRHLMHLYRRVINSGYATSRN